MATATEILNLDGVSHRVEAARFDLCDALGVVIGSITPTRVVSIDNRSDGSIKRTITNWVMSPDVAADVNPLTDRIRARWELSTGDEYPLGLFLFATYAGARRSYGVTVSARLLDQGVILGQPISTSIGFPSNTLCTDALATVFGRAGFSSYTIDTTTPTPLYNAVAWAAGSTNTYAKIASYLCAAGGLTDWYFDNDGLLRVDRQPDLTTTSNLVYNAGGRIIAGSIVEQNDALNAPNRFIAVDTANREAPIFGTYDLPDDSPNSIRNRGFAIVATLDAPGVGTEAAAETFARNYAVANPRAYETVTFSGPPDPRHDTYDVVEYLGVNYQEQSWRLTCAPGGPHEHTIQRVYL